MDKNILEKAKKWTTEAFDEVTRTQVEQLIATDEGELTECFYKDLEFGTGGLRGIMGTGTNRVNIYTVGMATQGLANYLKSSFDKKMSVAIAHDCRHNSPLFARKTAEVFAANGIRAYLFPALRPTPELSFAIRHLGCQAGVMITASHNPKEYNGYKAYWEDGGQLVAPHDKNVINEVKKVEGPEHVQWDADEELITILDEKIDDTYANAVRSLCLSPKAVKAQNDLKIVFTNLHGTAGTMIPRCLKDIGFTQVHEVAEQAMPDGDFPTVASPNPEEKAALRMALEQAEDIGADLVMGCDPDADRVGIAVRNSAGRLELLNGNMTGSLLIHYLITRWKELGKLDGKQFTAKTIVTSDLIRKISEKEDVPCYNVLTGFKYIGDLIRKLEGEQQFIGGGEESYGYLAGDLVRDKDAVVSCVLIAEMCAWAKDQGKSPYDLLLDNYMEHGFYYEDLISIKKEGRSGAEEIAQMMESLRNDPPKMLGDSDVTTLRDFRVGIITDLGTGEEKPTGLPSSNVLQFETSNGSVVTARPSGTEPKIKFYFSVNMPMTAKKDHSALKDMLRQKVSVMQIELGIS